MGVKPMNDLIPIEQPADIEPPEPNFDGLTALQSAFVRAYVQNGDGNATQAARDAGYSPASAAVVGHRLLRNQAVLDAIQRLTAQALGPMAPMMLKQMQHLALHARSEFVQQQAAADLLDRAGFKPPERHRIQGSGGVTIDIRLE